MRKSLEPFRRGFYFKRTRVDGRGEHNLEQLHRLTRKKSIKLENLYAGLGQFQKIAIFFFFWGGCGWRGGVLQLNIQLLSRKPTTARKKKKATASKHKAANLAIANQYMNKSRRRFKRCNHLRRADGELSYAKVSQHKHTFVNLDTIDRISPWNIRAAFGLRGP